MDGAPKGGLNYIGKDAPKATEVDLGEVDQPIPGQEYVVFSCLRPSIDKMEMRSVFMFEQFMKWYLIDYAKSLVETVAKDNGLDHVELFEKYKLIPPRVQKNPNEITDDEWEKIKMDAEKPISFEGPFAETWKTLTYKFATYKEANHAKVLGMLEKEYGTKFDQFIKIRGVVPTQDKGKELAQRLLKSGSQAGNMFMTRVGYWTGYDQQALDSREVETLNQNLNQVLWDRMKNQKISAEEFEKYKNELTKDKKFKDVDLFGKQ